MNALPDWDQEHSLLWAKSTPLCQRRDGDPLMIALHSSRCERSTRTSVPELLLFCHSFLLIVPAAIFDGSAAPPHGSTSVFRVGPSSVSTVVIPRLLGPSTSVPKTSSPGIDSLSPNIRFDTR